MFKLIEPKNRELQKVLIDGFLNIINKNTVFVKAFPDLLNATFILTEDTANGVSGGALLLKQAFSSLQKDIRKSLSSPTWRNKEVWTCVVALHINNYNLVNDFESCCKSFYQNLYEKFIEFATQEKISFLYMILEPGEYLCTEAIGFWPYVVEVRPQNSLDGLFHGILCLTPNNRCITIKTSETLFSQAKKQAA